MHLQLIAKWPPHQFTARGTIAVIISRVEKNQQCPIWSSKVSTVQMRRSTRRNYLSRPGLYYYRIDLLDLKSCHLDMFQHNWHLYSIAMRSDFALSRNQLQWSGKPNVSKFIVDDNNWKLFSSKRFTSVCVQFEQNLNKEPACRANDVPRPVFWAK